MHGVGDIKFHGRRRFLGARGERDEGCLLVVCWEGCSIGHAEGVGMDSGTTICV